MSDRDEPEAFATDGPSLTLPARQEHRTTMHEITQILDALAHGDRQAAGQLLPLVYDELRRLAARKLVQEKPVSTKPAATTPSCAAASVRKHERKHKQIRMGYLFLSSLVLSYSRAFVSAVYYNRH